MYEHQLGHKNITLGAIASFHQRIETGANDKPDNQIVNSCLKSSGSCRAILITGTSEKVC